MPFADAARSLRPAAALALELLDAATAITGTAPGAGDAAEALAPYDELLAPAAALAAYGDAEDLRHLGVTFGLLAAATTERYQPRTQVMDALLGGPDRKRRRARPRQARSDARADLGRPQRPAAADLACVLSDLRAWAASNAVQQAEAVDRIERSLDGEPFGPYESTWALLGETRDLARERERELDALLADARRTLEDLDRLELDLLTLD